MPAQIARFLLATLLVLSVTGCTSKVVDTGYLEGGYLEFNAIDTKSAKLRIDESLKGEVAQILEVSSLIDEGSAPVPVQPVVFVVPPTENHSEWVLEDPEDQEQLLFTVRERLYRYLLRNYPAPTRVRYAYMQSDPITRNLRVITITSRITDQEEGVGFFRYFLGYGIGMARLQLEGEIFEGPNRERKIGEYAIRRGHGGYAQNGLNVNVMKADYCLRYAAEDAVNDLTELLADRVPGFALIPEHVAQLERSGGPQGQGNAELLGN